MALAVVAQQSVHAPMGQHLIYIRRSYKAAADADVSDETQEAMCRAVLPAGASVRVISDSGGHQSGSHAARDGYQALLAAVAAGASAGLDPSRIEPTGESGTAGKLLPWLIPAESDDDWVLGTA